MNSIEKELLNSIKPLEILGIEEETTAFNERGIWLNKKEVCNWSGPIPISQYELNKDESPEIITKTIQTPVDYVQDISIKYLKPPTPPPHGDLIIRQENEIIRPEAPPQIIRQSAARPKTPDSLTIREKPPAFPQVFPQQTITITGKIIDPPPRKVIIEKMPQLPSKPQSVIIEKWLPYEKQKRKITFESTTVKEAPKKAVKNLIIEWQQPNSIITKEIKYVGMERADPKEYLAKYGSSLRNGDDLPKFALDLDYISRSSALSPELKSELEKLKPKVVELNSNNSDFLTLNKNNNVNKDALLNDLPELEGDLAALKLIDLDKVGLGGYKNVYLKKNDYESITHL